MGRIRALDLVVNDWYHRRAARTLFRRFALG